MPASSSVSANRTEVYWADSTGRRNAASTVRRGSAARRSTQARGGWPAADAFAWPPAGGAAGGAAAVLVGNSPGTVERGRGGGGRCVATGREPVVPPGCRHAADQPGTAVVPF